MDTWLAARGQTRGALLSLEETWALARAWYGPRLQAGWRGRSADEVHRLLGDVGLTGPFWDVR